MNLVAITVCYNYADYLQHVTANKECFDRWVIVTVEQDEETISVCKEHNLEFVFSDRLLTDGGFHKGKAINDGLLQIEQQDWVCLLDADTLLMVNAFKKVLESNTLDPNCIYGLYGRYKVGSSNELQSFLQKQVVESVELENIGLLVGYFQMWHTSMRRFYPEQWAHAGGDDILMRDSYDQTKWRYLPTFGIHLGELFKNHKGRKTERFV